MFSNSNLIRHYGGCAGARRLGGLVGLPHLTALRVLTFVFLIVIEHVSHIGGYVAQRQHSPHVLPDTHRLAKRMDLEACLGQFDVHNNTIIRTGESQAIGGKYLQGLELDTMEECQRLCCETDSCDVYIFEDKNGGYCYLFHCGPPENFHCKFTRHANYTSAVLTPIKIVPTPRPPPPANPVHPSTTNQESQQEWELSNLKVKPDAREKLAELAAGISSATNGNNMQQKQRQTGQQVDIGFPQKAVVNTTAPQCSRFQFPCHSGECIAVYNVCDGIPQCEDGSDEGPECSGAAGNNVAQSNSKGALATANVNSLALDTGPDQKYRTMQQTSQQQLQNLQQQQTQSTQTINAPIVNNREDVGAWANRKIVAESQQTDGVNPGDLNSHIFTHKNGLQLPHNVGGGNTGSNSNTGAIDMNAGVANYPNSNANLNPLYAPTMQRNGVYLPQVVPAQQQNEGLYAVPQQQMLDQQAPIYVPANVNWAQQQQQQIQQFPAVVTPLTMTNERGTQMGQGPTYVVNTPQQTMPHFTQQQQQGTEQQVKVAFIPATNLNGAIAPQQQIQGTGRIAVGQQSAAVVTNVQNSVDNDSSKGSIKKVLTKADEGPAATDAESYEDYEDQSTEAPKKKPRKHKKVKAKPSTTNTVGKELPNIPKADLTDDPIQQSIAQRNLQQQQSQSLTQSQPRSPVHEQYKMLHQNLGMEFLDHDGQSDRPGGAVLSLTLGLLVTAALGILIGCRMRTVGRRARRLGGKFSHEADFLVNGMYL